MPQFILNTPPSRADAQRAVAYGYLKPAKRRAVHPFNYLDEFAQVYDSAMRARAFGECYVEAWRGWIHVR